MTNTFLPLRLAILLVFLITGCEEETEKIIPPTTVQFENSLLSIVEDTDKSNVKILLSGPAKIAGELTVQLTTADASRFTTEPAATNNVIKLPVITGESTVSFELRPLNNALLDGDKTIGFTITSITEGFVLGNNKELSATLVDDETPAQVNFTLNAGAIRENNGEGSTVIINLSQNATANGLVHVSVESDDAAYGAHFATEPALINGKISLPVIVGVSHVQFKVIPVNDELYNKSRTIAYTITDVEGGVVKGQSLVHELKITDDELTGTGKGYEIFAGNWRYKRNYAYDESGRLLTVHFEQNTPGYSEGTHSYFYDAGGKVTKVVESPVRETIFLWEEDRIVKTEEYTNNVLTKYTLFGYDAVGNVGESALYHRQPDGQYKMSFLFVYLYKKDGNLFKQLVHTPIDGSEDYNLIATRTYDNYLDVENPFPMVEILPNHSTQPKLPSSYRVEENGHDILYQFSYEFSEDGKPVKRTATSSSGSETAYYEYY
jgi:hypothetical protein